MIDLRRETPIDVEWIAERFKVSKRTVSKWFARGLERLKIGGRVYSSIEAVQRFAAQCETTNAHKTEAIRKELRERWGIVIDGDPKPRAKPKAKRGPKTGSAAVPDASGPEPCG